MGHKNKGFVHAAFYCGSPLPHRHQSLTLTNIGANYRLLGMYLPHLTTKAVEKPESAPSHESDFHPESVISAGSTESRWRESPRHPISGLQNGFPSRRLIRILSGQTLISVPECMKAETRTVFGDVSFGWVGLMTSLGAAVLRDAEGRSLRSGPVALAYPLYR